MILNTTKKILNAKFGTGEIQILKIEGKSITYLVPYDNQEQEVEIETETMEEQIKEFVAEVNQKIDSMINQLGDCQLILEELI